MDRINRIYKILRHGDAGRRPRQSCQSCLKNAVRLLRLYRRHDGKDSKRHKERHGLSSEGAQPPKANCGKRTQKCRRDDAVSKRYPAHFDTYLILMSNLTRRRTHSPEMQTPRSAPRQGPTRHRQYTTLSQYISFASRDYYTIITECGDAGTVIA